MLNKRETVLLAHNFNPDKYNVKDWFASPKLDGMRAIWDGGISRGLMADEVPFASINKHDRYIKQVKATGLWTRYLQPIQAPDWFLNNLPNHPLDGELYIGPDNFTSNKFQEVMSICKTLTPSEIGWKKVKYYIFDMPTLNEFLKPGKINNPNLPNYIIGDYWDWIIERMKKIGSHGKRPKVYHFYEIVEYFISHRKRLENEVVQIIEQESIPDNDYLINKLNLVTSLGNEGLMLRHANSHWEPKRSHELLKMKKLLDGEGVVVGYTGGDRTSKGSKLLGLMGSLIIRWYNPTIGKEIEFELSGFNNEERELYFYHPDTGKYVGNANLIVQRYPKLRIPLKDANNNTLIMNPNFPIGSTVTFKYHDLSNDGIPRFARYFRKYN